MHALLASWSLQFRYWPRKMGKSFNLYFFSLPLLLLLFYFILFICWFIYFLSKMTSCCILLTREKYGTRHKVKFEKELGSYSISMCVYFIIISYKNIKESSNDRYCHVKQISQAWIYLFIRGKKNGNSSDSLKILGKVRKFRAARSLKIDNFYRCENF